MAEFSTERRILLAFTLSFLVLALWNYLGPKYEPPEPAPPEEPLVVEFAPPPQVGPEEVAPLAAPGVLEAGEERLITVETEVATIELTNRGARVRRWTLKQFKQYDDEEGGPLDLVQGVTTELGLPFSLEVANPEEQETLNQALFVVETSWAELQAPVEVVFRWSDGELAASKRFRFGAGYLLEVETEVTRAGQPVEHRVAWLGGFGDAAAATSQFPAQVLLRTPEKVRRHPAAMATETDGVIFKSYPPFPYEGPAAYAGIEDRYFAAVFFPEAGSLTGTAATVQWTPPATPDNESPQPQPVGSVALGSPPGGTNRFQVFVGPKALEEVGPIGEQVGVPELGNELVNFGFFWFVAKPIFLGMKWMYTGIPNYGWVIVGLTILINLLLFPLKWKSLQSAFMMQKVAPQMRAIQARYKQYKFNDPRKQEMQKEIMALYKQHGVNPLGGCLPLLLQLPFFYGFYTVLSTAIELRQAPWFGWIQDLSQKDPYYVLPLLMGGMMYVSTKMTPISTPDPAQQRMMQLFPLFLTFLFLQVSSGLVLYWTTSNVVGIAQQWFINKRMRERQEAEKLAAREERRMKKKRHKQLPEAPDA